jgi:RecA/RadA recombinase
VTARALADAAATEAAGAALGRGLRAGDVIALCGDLGAGKTTFVRGLAQGAGAATDDVASPTFALANEYAGRVVVAHQTSAIAPWYISSRTATYFFSTALRLTLRLGVSSPASTVRSAGRIANFLIVSHLASSPLTWSM